MNDNLTPAQRYYQRHKDARRAYGREYYQRNRDKILAAAELRRTAKDEAKYVENYIAERSESPKNEVIFDTRHQPIHLLLDPDDVEELQVTADITIDKIAPVAKSPLDAYRGRGAHTKTSTRTKNVSSKGIKVSGPVVVSFS